MPGWFRSRAKPRLRPIDPALWRRATSSWLFMRGVTPAESEKLRGISERFLHSKKFAGTHTSLQKELMSILSNDSGTATSGCEPTSAEWKGKHWLAAPV